MQSYSTWLRGATSEQVEGLKNAAKSLDTHLGGLYMGHKDCVRSMMCFRSGGQFSHNGMCVACAALGNNKAFRERVQATAAFDHLDEATTR